MHELAGIADRFGAGELRLTVWQNLLIPHIPDARVDAAKQALLAAGLHYTAASVRGGLVACTGNTGCKFAATNTKGQALALAEHLERRVALDQPVNIHLTGCPHSCAQHYIGDIGLMGVKVRGPDGGTEEGYNVVLGGGVDDDQFIAREAFKAVPFHELPALLERLLNTYLQQRRDRETFAQFTRRHDLAVLLNLFQSAA
jgi:ferredoxin-nitrite reductase